MQGWWTERQGEPANQAETEEAGEQGGQYADEVNEPHGSTQVNKNGSI